jgi:hypothetical protein
MTELIETLMIIALFSVLGYTLGPEEDIIDIERD